MTQTHNLMIAMLSTFQLCVDHNAIIEKRKDV